MSEQDIGHVGRRRRDHDALERRLFGPAQAAVAGERGDVDQTEAFKPFLGLLQQRRMALDGVEAAAQPRQNRRLKARPGADLQHLHALADVEGLGHPPDDAGLAQGLVVADGQRHVLVGTAPERFGHEYPARRRLDRPQHASLGDPLAAKVEHQAGHFRPDVHLKSLI
uniref:Uncharacterized protein n=1 Tax=uncultured marine microorganism HF4000_APKG2J17 TaxID=455546 RepID=B3T6I6_9ZZZZ|nr:hypothetical protein ALOHA_HF4000APKG2J17ctg1g2 [uncultured marine microorganism HF4000_APKG2J17]